jgi:hypothetical protein
MSWSPDTATAPPICSPPGKECDCHVASTPAASSALKSSSYSIGGKVPQAGTYHSLRCAQQMCTQGCYQTDRTRAHRGGGGGLIKLAGWIIGIGRRGTGVYGVGWLREGISIGPKHEELAFCHGHPAEDLGKSTAIHCGLSNNCSPGKGWALPRPRRLGRARHRVAAAAALP